MRVLGIILLGLCIACVGFKKAAILNRRYSVLKDLLISFGEAQQRVKLRQEKDIIIEKLFSPPFVIKRENSLEITVHNPDLTPQDNLLLNEFIKDFGMGDLNSQLELLEVYRELIKGRIAEAKAESSQKAGMYRTCSVLAAIGAVILLI